MDGDVQAQAAPAPASPPSQGTLWKRADQLQHQRLADGVQAYRAGDFATARKQFEGIDSDAGWYNLANTLARQGSYDEAIAAYDRALALHPGMADAVANRAVVDAARKRRQSGAGAGPAEAAAERAAEAAEQFTGPAEPAGPATAAGPEGSGAGPTAAGPAGPAQGG